jgi:tRNA threonylcarbamoyl adenosine modification protein YjeE
MLVMTQKPAGAPAAGSPPLPHATWTVPLPDEAATQALAAELGACVGAGDLVTLTGELGAGKTAFARHMIRSLVGDAALEVPSPTFTLIQAYEGPRFPIVHADLYRISGTDELAELGWEEAAEGSLVLVEWPERAGFLLGSERLDVKLALDPAAAPGGRIATVTGYGALAPRVALNRAVQSLLQVCGWAGATRTHIQGDASSRLYERLRKEDGSTAILMVAPRRPDGPPVRMGKSYPTIARLATSVHAFLAMDQALIAQGLSAPRILAADLQEGLVVTEDLGAAGVTDENGPIPERYAAAAELLALLHGRTLPTVLPLDGERDYTIPPYDLDALSIEVELMLDWYMPAMGTTPSGSSRSTFLKLWREALEPVLAEPVTWTLRDVHSPNLFWLPEREGVKRIGIIDFQDTVLGPPAYDVAALLQDARVDVPDDLELRLLGAYARARRAADPAFDMGAFARAYAVMGAQRNTKILGIFRRLDRRDGKPQYLRHLPRIERAVRKNLAHPALADLRGWYEANLPWLFPQPEAAPEPGAGDAAPDAQDSPQPSPQAMTGSDTPGD